MAHEWKVGDRFTLEFEVTGWSGEWLECKTMSSARRAFPPSDMQYAKLIHPAAPEPQKLDTSKPMRLKGSGKLAKYIDRDEFKIVIRFESGYIEFANEDELENIPEPKQITTQIVELVHFDFGPRITMKSQAAYYVNVSSRAKVTYTDGEGWSICEVES